MMDQVLVVPRGTTVSNVLITAEAALQVAEDQEVLAEATRLLKELQKVLDGREVTRAAVVLAAWALLVSVVQWALKEQNPVQ